jgi:methyl-CpG-binding domain protein 4
MTQWVPPKSNFDLLQERFWPDEWKVLVTCILLNQTSRKQVEPMIEDFFFLCPNPQAAIEADEDCMVEILKPLGMYNKRAKTIKRMSEDFIVGFTQAKQLYGCGKYADDAYRLFFVGDWQDVTPSDHALNDYHGFLLEKYSRS